MILILFIPSVSLKAQYPTIKKLNNDTVSIFNIDNTKVLAKICMDREYLLNVEDTLHSIIDNQTNIITNIKHINNNNVSIINHKDSIINNKNSEIGLYIDVIDDNERVIKNQKTSLIIHKIVIIGLSIIAIIK